MKKIFIIGFGSLLLSFGAFAMDSADLVSECETDADCPSQFVCQTIQIPCDAPATMPCQCEPCADDATDGCGCVCPVYDVVECTSGGEYRMCSWEPLKCSDDVDCPDGFECITEEMCYGTGCTCPYCVCPSDSDVPCDCPDVVCDCGDVGEPVCELGDSYCMPGKVPCLTDDDCAEGFACSVFDTGVICACPDCLCPECPPDTECEPCECDACSCEDAAVGEVEAYCLPANWSEYIGLEDGELVYEPAWDSDLGKVVGQDGDAVDTGNPANDEDVNTDGNNCSAGTTGSFPWVLLVGFAAVLIARRRFE